MKVKGILVSMPLCQDLNCQSRSGSLKCNPLPEYLVELFPGWHLLVTLAAMVYIYDSRPLTFEHVTLLTFVNTPCVLCINLNRVIYSCGRSFSSKGISQLVQYFFFLLFFFLLLNLHEI